MGGDLRGSCRANHRGARIFGLQLELGYVTFAIGVSVLGNLIAILVFPKTNVSA